MLFALLGKVRLIADLLGVGLIGVLGLLLKWKTNQLNDIKVNNIISGDKAAQKTTEEEMFNVEAAVAAAKDGYLHAYHDYNSSLTVHSSGSGEDDDQV